MKRSMIIIILAACIVGGMNAQHVKKGVSAKYPQFEIIAAPQAAASEKAALPFLAGRCETGKKEQFGVVFAGIGGTMPVIEFLAAGNKVVKTMTVNDLLGKSADNGVRFVQSKSNESETQCEASYELTFPQGRHMLTIRTISTGESDGSKGRIVMSFLMKPSVRDINAVRISLPVEGGATTQDNGFVLAAKNQPVAISAAVFPKPQSIAYAKNSIVIQTAVPPASGAQAEQALAWMVVEGGSSSAAPGMLTANVKNSAKPSLIIVTSANKESTQPADTLTYTLVCVNVGLGSAADIVLKNPIPAGTSYIESSATGQGTEISLERERAAAPQQGTVSSVQWKLKEPLHPGAEKIVSFKVIVR